MAKRHVCDMQSNNVANELKSWIAIKMAYSHSNHASLSGLAYSVMTNISMQSAQMTRTSLVLRMMV